MSTSSHDQSRIARNVDHIRQRMSAAAARVGREANAVSLIAVTKSVGIAEVEALYAEGLRHFAENRPELSAEKVAAMPTDCVWHMIGNLQRRKVKMAVELFSRIDAVDRLELLDTLQQRCAELAIEREILIEVNVSGEAAKHGITPAELSDVLTLAASCSALKVGGLLTMAPFDAPEAVLRRTFSGLRELVQQHRLPRISMGMTDDFEIAIEEGATEVRIGRALFE